MDIKRQNQLRSARSALYKLDATVPRLVLIRRAKQTNQKYIPAMVFCFYICPFDGILIWRKHT